MALRSVASIYRSISKPSLQRGFSSFSNTLVKRNNSAEDAVVDNQYEGGLISAETYRLELTKRLSRDYITPLQRVNLQEKIGKVAETLFDAEVDRKYAAGEYTTDQVLQYEQDKLGGIPQTDTVAYQRQAQKVQGLIDKGERENRTAFRIEQIKRIAQMPEDTSEKLYAKAQVYEQLENQARLDGDNQTADTLATQKINYQNSAKRAEVNDLITGARLSVSGTPREGLGIPSAEEGGKLVGYQGIRTPAVNNALESLDRGQKTIQRLYQQREDAQAMISAYQDAISQASGDQKTSLTIALNNIVDGVSGIDNSIANAQQNIQDTVVRIQEIQAKAAASAFSQEVRRNNQLFQKAENELETALAQGKISKEEYLGKGTVLAEDKYSFYSSASDGFSQFGNDSSAESYIQKASDLERIYENLSNIGENIDDYELVSVDPGGTINNIFGKQLRPGEFSLTNIRRLKDRGVFDEGYVRKGNAYYKVYYPAEYVDATGELLPQYVNKDLAELRETAYIYDAKGDQEFIKRVMFTDEKGTKIRAVSQKDVDTLLKQGVIISDPKKGLIQKPKFEPSLLLKGGAKIQQTLENVIPEFKEFGEGIRGERPLKIPTILSKALYSPFPSKQMIQGIQKFVQNTIKSPQVQNVVKGIQGAIKGTGETVSGLVKNVSGFFAPRVEAATPKKQISQKQVQTTGDYDDLIAMAGIDPGEAARVLQGENSGRDPNAENRNRNGSIDRGLFQINSNTFTDFMRRKGGELRKFGIETFEDMFDPEKNSIMAGFIKAEQGWRAWYGAPADLRAKPPTRVNPVFRPTVTPTPTKIPIQKVSTRPGGIVSPLPDSQRVRSIPAGFVSGVPTSQPRSFAQDLFRQPIPTIQNFATNTAANLAKQITSFQPPKIQIPQFQLPKISLPKFELPKPVQQVAQNIGKTVQNVAKNVGSFFGGLFKRR